MFETSFVPRTTGSSIKLRVIHLDAFCLPPHILGSEAGQHLLQVNMSGIGKLSQPSAFLCTDWSILTKKI